MLSDREIKEKFRPIFFQNYKKFYPAKTLKELGYNRYVCKRCGIGFWSTHFREFCDDCTGKYDFIGKSPAKRKVSYREGWEVFVKIFKKWGYVPIKRYPVVARWYDELYFVDAGVNIFQPYVVSGEVEPPAPATLEPQFCLRFNDIPNVGFTGRHYTGFIMVGQHTFNTPERYVYFKEEGIQQIYEFLTKGLKIPKEEIVFHEDMWAGGGNFGPCIEFFSRGLELGNQVYMQYELLPDGSYKELKTKVIDMGAGLERWAWFTQGVPMSYDVTFPYVLKRIYKEVGLKPNRKLMKAFAPYSTLLEKKERWREISELLGMEESVLREEISRQAAIYSIADHTRTLLVAIHDGGLPSNVSGGYNLRNILRRCWSLIDRYNLDLELEKVFEWHIKEFGSWFEELKEVGKLFDIIQVERERYISSITRARKAVVKALEKGLTEKDVITLYQSYGVMPETIRQVAEELGVRVDIRREVYNELRREEPKPRKKSRILEKELETKPLFYEKQREYEFDANVIWRKGNWVVLDKTLFYPTAGGQLHDTGEINGIKVLEVVQEGKAILHKLQRPLRGKKVHGVVDRERRKMLEKMHTATHILNAACRKLLGPHVWQHGAEKTPEKSRLDITHYKSLTKEEVREIEESANRVVMENRRIKVRWMERGEAERKYGMRIYQGGAAPGKFLRIVEIEGWDVEACGGLHCESTGEVGLIKILNVERIQDGVVRINFVAGERALEHLWRDEELLRQVSDLWGVSKELVPKTAERFFKEWKLQRKLIERLAEQLVKRLVEKGELEIEIPTNDMGLLIKLGKKYRKDGLTLFGERVGYGFGERARNSLKKRYSHVEGDYEIKAWS